MHSKNNSQYSQYVRAHIMYYFLHGTIVSPLTARARREGLKSNFHKLRDTVPELVGNKRVPKGLILKKAADYIRELCEEARTLEVGLP